MKEENWKGRCSLGDIFGSNSEEGLRELQSEGREAMLHLSENWITFWVAFIAGCLCALERVCACHNRTHTL